jgi:hypothetical protein
MAALMRLATSPGQNSCDGGNVSNFQRSEFLVTKSPERYDARRTNELNSRPLAIWKGKRGPVATSGRQLPAAVRTCQ